MLNIMFSFGKINIVMKKQFIPYELSLKLKALGFNEKCFDVHGDTKSRALIHASSPRDRTPKILWQQAFDWFRTEHNLHALNSPVLNQEWTVVIDNTLNAHQVYWDKKPNYEEARLECIRKLIEIVENKKG